MLFKWLWLHVEKGGVIFVRIISAFVKKTLQRRWIFCVLSGLCNLISSFPVSQKLWYSSVHVYLEVVFFLLFALCCLFPQPESKGIVNNLECLFAQLIFPIVLTLFKAFRAKRSSLFPWGLALTLAGLWRLLKWQVNPQRSTSHSAKYGKSHEHVYCGAQGAAWAAPCDPVAPSSHSVFTGAQCVYCLWGFVCVCWREMLLWGLMGQGHYKAGVCAVRRTVLAGMYVHTNAQKQRLIVDAQAQLVCTLQ